AYGTACCPAHDNRRTPALSLADGADGRLLAKCHAGCDFVEIITALKRLGLAPPMPERIVPTGSARSNARRPSPRAFDEAAADQRDIAKRLWDLGVPIGETLAEDYLNARGIALQSSQALRFSASCRHGPHQNSYPALLARIDRIGENDLVGIHRTFLSIRGTKIPTEPSRLALGAVAGGAVRLVVGQGSLVVAEGLETALSAAELIAPPDASVWAALTTSGLSGLTLPRLPTGLIIAADNDAPGLRAADVLSARARRTGWHVVCRPPPSGFNDWNDVAQARRGLSA
ncbi:MAG: toprim domain-containing protein, partial [Pseudomonadota bacterium]